MTITTFEFLMNNFFFSFLFLEWFFKYISSFFDKRKRWRCWSMVMVVMNEVLFNFITVPWIHHVTSIE